jgi:hypothetical protein
LVADAGGVAILTSILSGDLAGDFASIFASLAAAGSRGTIDLGANGLRIGGSKASDLSKAGGCRDFLISSPSRSKA